MLGLDGWSSVNCCKQLIATALHTEMGNRFHFRCPLYPRKRTCAVQLEMSALGQKRTLD
jgi:hypothetical protein